MMSNPYDVLELTRGCSQEDVRRRYLALVREHPPDRDPDRFAAIRAAYEQLRDPVRRLENELFTVATNNSLDAIIGTVRKRLRERRIPLETLLSLAEK